MGREFSSYFVCRKFSGIEALCFICSVTASWLSAGSDQQPFPASLRSFLGCRAWIQPPLGASAVLHERKLEPKPRKKRIFQEFGQLASC